MEGLRITNKLSEMDFDGIHEFIRHSYWAKGMPATTLKKALENSLCFAVIDQEGHQRAFARLITDHATFAYLADVFVAEAYRGQGISKWLIEAVLSHSSAQGLRRILLATEDAHGLYQQFGFNEVTVEEARTLMQIRDPNVYLSEL